MRHINTIIYVYYLDWRWRYFPNTGLKCVHLCGTPCILLSRKRLFFSLFFSHGRVSHGGAGVRGMRYADQHRVADGHLFREYTIYLYILHFVRVPPSAHNYRITIYYYVIIYLLLITSRPITGYNIFQS